MLKKTLILSITFFFLTTNVFAAGSGGDGGSEGGSAKVKSNYKLLFRETNTMRHRLRLYSW